MRYDNCYVSIRNLRNLHHFWCRKRKSRCGNIRTRRGNKSIQRETITCVYIANIFAVADDRGNFLVNYFSDMNKAKTITSDPATTSRLDFSSRAISYTRNPWSARRVFSFNIKLITPYLIGCTHYAWVICIERDLPMTICTVLKRSLFNAENKLPLALERKQKYQDEFWSKYKIANIETWSRQDWWKR